MERVRIPYQGKTVDADSLEFDYVRTEIEIKTEDGQTLILLPEVQRIYRIQQGEEFAYLVQGSQRLLQLKGVGSKDL